MFKIIFYAPEDHVEKIKLAMFEAGAGQVGEYSHCSWQVLGEGQFMPLDGSHAFSGEKNKLEKCSEWKVEMVCNEMCLQDTVVALRENHPYEEPAFQVIRLEIV